jgi:hypothetical protein
MQQEASMTRDELAEKLNHLDPGAVFAIPEGLLASVFDQALLSYDSHEALRYIADFALEHRCTFSFHEHGGTGPFFQKDDVF